MRPEVLRGMLTKAQREAGYELVEVDDHLITLERYGVVRARFHAPSVSVQEIQGCRALRRRDGQRR